MCLELWLILAVSSTFLHDMFPGHGLAAKSAHEVMARWAEADEKAHDKGANCR